MMFSSSQVARKSIRMGGWRAATNNSNNLVLRWRRTFITSSTSSSPGRCSVVSKTSSSQGIPSLLGAFQQNHFKFGGGLQQHQQQQIRSIFIQTSETPNPESLKFIPTGVHVLGYPNADNENDTTASGYYVTRNDNQVDILRSPLAKKLLDIDGVKAVYLGPDFVTVTKYAENKWKLLRPRLFEVIMDWADNVDNEGGAALLDHPIITDTTIHDDDSEVVAMIKELIEARIRPAVQEDGGDIHYVSFDEESGLVKVQLAGSCVGCPSSAVTLKQGVENMLMHYIPEVKLVEALEEEPDDGPGGGGSGPHDAKKADNDKNDDEPMDEASKKQRTYQERLAQAGIPFAE